MDGGRLRRITSSIKLFLIGKSSFLWAGLVVAVVAFIVFLLWWFTPYFDDLYALIPGYYQNNEYNELTDTKNSLIEENAEFLIESEEYEVSLGSVSTSEEGYDQMIQINGDIVSVNQSVRENLVEILEVDEQLTAMQLPDVVRQYVRYSYELDEVRMDMVELSIQIGSARRDLAEFNKYRMEFDTCLSDVDWSESDTVIGTSVEACADKIVNLQDRVLLMEGQHAVELEEMKNSLKLLSEQWNANAGYYHAIAEGNYSKATDEFDVVFVERRRQISELDVVDILNEFYVEGIGPMLKELIEFGEEESEKEQHANDWYERNLVR